MVVMVVTLWSCGVWSGRYTEASRVPDHNACHHDNDRTGLVLELVQGASRHPRLFLHVNSDQKVNPQGSYFYLKQWLR